MYVDLCTILSCRQHNRQNKYYIEYLAMYKIVIVRLTILAPFLHHMNFCNLSFFYVWCEPPWNDMVLPTGNSDTIFIFIPQILLCRLGHCS